MAVLSLVFLLLGAGLAYRLVDLQLRNPERLTDWGESQRERSVTLPGRRGDLLDRNGEQLAISVPQRTIWADPRLITNPREAAEQLAPLLEADVQTILGKLTTPGAFVYLERQVSDEAADQVVALGIEGVETLMEPKRFNPSGNRLAEAVIGTVGIDHDGLSGIEEQYEAALAGTAGQMSFETSPAGRTIATGANDREPARRGADLVLTIDRPLQYETEQVLVEHVEATGADGGVAVVMDTDTGEVLSVANVVRNGDGLAVTSGENRALTWAFEPGSVMKPLTFAAVLEEGVADEETELVVPYEYQIYDRTFSDSAFHDTMVWDLRTILTKSSNVGTIMFAQELGGETLNDYLYDFGFGEVTGLDFKGETQGIVLEYGDWSGTTIGTVPIGQGISVTPLQMVAAINTIANDGVYVAPRLVKEIIPADGEPFEPEGPEPRRVVSEDTAERIAALMANVVSEGTGQAAAIDQYAVAGKTGTARKVLANGTYEDELGAYHYIATFTGFFPADDPEISMVVVLDEPRSSIYAGTVAAPIFADLGRYTLRRFRIPPTIEVVTDLEPVAPVDDGSRVRGEEAIDPEELAEQDDGEDGTDGDVAGGDETEVAAAAASGGQVDGGDR